jgi:hypothetical protein
MSKQLGDLGTSSAGHGIGCQSCTGMAGLFSLFLVAHSPNLRRKGRQAHWLGTRSLVIPLVWMTPCPAVAHTSLLPDTQTTVRLGKRLVRGSRLLEAPLDRTEGAVLEWALGPCLAEGGSMMVAGSIGVWLLASVLLVSARMKQPLIGLGKWEVLVGGA